MQTICTSYRQAGHAMQLLRREGNAAMFRSVDKTYWEVHRIRVAKPCTIKGQAYPQREILAGNEDFGPFGWACVTQDRADGRFAEILAR